ncbi:MAG: D-inositol-3-phosphate glycosyltransferase [Kerstersia gyiorum]
MRTFIFLNPSFFPNIGGAENSIFEMAKAAEANGDKAIIVCGTVNKIDDRLLPLEEMLSPAITVKRFESKRSYLAYWHCVKILRESRQKKSNDVIVISRNHVMALCARVAGFRMVNYMVPSVMYYQDKKTVRSAGIKSIGRYIGHATTQCLAFCMSKTYAFSRTIARQINRASLFVSKPRLLNPGINTDRFFSLSPEEIVVLRRQLGIDVAATVLLGVGRFIELKQYHLAVEALASLPENYVLVLVGAGPELDRYKSVATSKRVQHRLKIFPATTDPVPYYQMSNLFMMTSRYETFGQVVLESVATGLGVVAFRNGGAIDTAVEDIFEGNGSLVAYADQVNARSLAKAIEMLAERCDSGIDESRQALLKKYSWMQVLELISNNLKK